jgi:Thioesterase-like superfamily
VNDQPVPRAAKPTPQLADYPHRITDNIRFGDLDPQGHVNQAVFLTYFESGRVAMFRNEDLGIGVPGLTFVMVRMEVDYMKELHWRLRRDGPRDAGLHGPENAQGHAAAAGRDRPAKPMEIAGRVSRRATTAGIPFKNRKRR